MVDILPDITNLYFYHLGPFVKYMLHLLPSPKRLKHRKERKNYVCYEAHMHDITYNDKYNYFSYIHNICSNSLRKL